MSFQHCRVRDPEGRHWVMPPHLTQTVLDRLSRELVVRPEDVFIVSYPKSGTHWMKQIVHLLSSGGHQGDAILEETIPFLDVEAADIGYWGLEQLGRRRGRRYFHSHLPPALMPGLREVGGKYIYVARNPKDCAASYYHFSIKYKHMGFDGGWDDFLALYLRGDVQYGSVFEHVSQWWRESQLKDNVLFVKYEDMHADLAAAIKRVAGFLGLPLSAEILRSVLEQSRFSSMKHNDKANGQWIEGFEGTSLLRSGKVGDWVRHFSSEQSRALDVLYEESMVTRGLQFDFLPVPGDR